MAMANEKKKIVYLLNPRTASRGTRAALMAAGWTDLQGGHHADREQTIRTIERVDDSWTFCQTVRHPCDVLSSEFHMSPEGLMKKFPRLIDWLNHGDLLEGVYNNPKNRDFRHHKSLFFSDCNLNLKYENLAAELKATWPDVLLKHDPNHKTPGKPDWEEEWGYHEREWAKKNLCDLERYGYVV